MLVVNMSLCYVDIDRNEMNSLQGILYLRMQEEFKTLQCFQAAAKDTFDYD